MNRNTSKEHITKLINELRNSIPNLTIRSTFIVGFPSETESDFEELIDFIKTYKLDRVGAFKYSREEDTKAYYMKDQVDEDIKTERLDKLMEVQQDISTDIMSTKIGKVFEVLIEEEIDDNYYIARSYMDAPEIDGNIYVSSEKKLENGSFQNVIINNSLEFDLEGEIL